ncbi:MAG TPA: transporter [Allosphingosinicella sp.]|nr:transporter [Allosphingosinicella sp.]
MRIVFSAITTASLLAVAAPAAAQQTPGRVEERANPFGLSFSTGIDYSSGDYGLDENTKILVVPFTLRATTGNLAFTASLPYLSIDGPGGVVVGPGGEPLPGVPTEGGKRDGIGDLSLGATYTIPAANLGGAELALGGRVKLPTSSRDQQLSTGKTDFSVSGDLSFPMGNVVPFVNLGYRWLGDPEGADLRNGPTASVGSSFVLGQSVLIASYDYARATSRLTEDSHEIFAGLSAPVSSAFTMTGYGVAGLSKGSPDFGLGVLLTAKVF